MFVARAMAGSDAAVPMTYGPDPATGRSYSCNSSNPNLYFTDVAKNDQYCRHTHYLWAKDVNTGVTGNSYQPGLNVSRGAMAKFRHGFPRRDVAPPGGGSARCRFVSRLDPRLAIDENASTADATPRVRLP